MKSTVFLCLYFSEEAADNTPHDLEPSLFLPVSKVRLWKPHPPGPRKMSLCKM